MKFHKLTPNFSVRDVRQTVKFYKDILGFKFDMAVPDKLSTIEHEISGKGEYAYAMVSRDDVYVMFLKSKSFEEDIPALKGFPQGASVLFYIDVEDIFEVYKKIKNRVELVKELETTWYGMREFYIKDCNGYVIGFAEKEHSPA